MERLHTAFDELYFTTQVKDNLNYFVPDTLCTASGNTLAVFDHRILSEEDVRSMTSDILQNNINVIQIIDNLNSVIADVQQRFTKSNSALINFNLLTKSDHNLPLQKLY